MRKFSGQIFVERLRQARGARTQKEIAETLGMKQPIYARYESGRTLPSAEILFNLATVLGASVDYLLGRTAPHVASDVARLRGDNP